LSNTFITGSTGFVGKNIINFFEKKTKFSIFKNGDKIKINENIVLHFAGKAHDLKNTIKTKEYYEVNTELTIRIFDAFLNSGAKVFITLSSVKAAADNLSCELSEEFIPNPITDYGKSKLLAEQYILSKEIPLGKRVYILRPCMIHGPGNKGNLNLLYNIVNKGIIWPFGVYENKRSFCSIDNLCFIIDELIMNDQIPSGVYNVADDEPISTNELINLISESQGKKSSIWNVPKYLVNTFAKIGDILKLPLNSERLVKLTESYIVSNNKIKNAINKPFPLSSRDGLTNTINSFKINA